MIEKEKRERRNSKGNKMDQCVPTSGRKIQQEKREAGRVIGGETGM